MAMVSPTPMSSHFGMRRQPLRPHLARHNAQAMADLPSKNHGISLGGNTHGINLGDSSDDDIAPPIFNKATNRLLEGEASILTVSSPPSVVEPAVVRIEGPPEVVKRRGDSGSVVGRERVRDSTTSPELTRRDAPIIRRVVRLSSTPHGFSSQRANSLQEPGRQVEIRDEVDSPMTTPARKRIVHIPVATTTHRSATSGSSSKPLSRLGSGVGTGESNYESIAEPATATRGQSVLQENSVSRYRISSRTRYGDDTGVPQSTIGVKKVGRGQFMRGPARRGRRRQSEEDQENDEDKENHVHDHDALAPTHESQPWHDEEPEIGRAQVTSQPSLLDSFSPIYSHQSARSESPVETAELRRPIGESSKPAASAKAPQPFFKVPPPNPALPNNRNQENEVPLTFKRDKPVPFSLLDQLDRIQPKAAVMEIHPSPGRKPLAVRSQNTPRRPAPPPPVAPPKMSVLDTATTASSTNKRRNAVKVNGKVFTRLDVLGRGGSGKVWRIMAENGHFYALKRVCFEDLDESTVRGFKGEIDLLEKLKGCDRVVQLIGFELNNDKNTLSVVMEMGELDFNTILMQRLKGEDAIFDPVFTRYYWKEMLECIRAVHARDIVHQDLKPANFVLVKGRLKLIDFGIANAIQTDMTVNVHRDSQVGTPNYMSPESLIEAHKLPGNEGLLARPDHTAPRLWKVGKPSDIWSLGCILYQMAYGRQPFAHIANQMSRCTAIMDYEYRIEYPAMGVGGARIPASLLKTMQRCLRRDQRERPTAIELLAESDEWLYPKESSTEHEPIYEKSGGVAAAASAIAATIASASVAENAVPITKELLGRIMLSVARRCEEGKVSEAELLTLWPEGYFQSLKKSAGLV